MGVRNTATEGVCAMYDSTDGRAFGPIFEDESSLDDFTDWADEHEPRDLRRLRADELDALVMQWRGARAKVT